MKVKENTGAFLLNLGTLLLQSLVFSYIKHSDAVHNLQNRTQICDLVGGSCVSPRNCEQITKNHGYGKAHLACSLTLVCCYQIVDHEGVTDHKNRTESVYDSYANYRTNSDRKHWKYEQSLVHALSYKASNRTELCQLFGGTCTEPLDCQYLHSFKHVQGHGKKTLETFGCTLTTLCCYGKPPDYLYFTDYRKKTRSSLLAYIPIHRRRRMYRLGHSRPTIKQRRMPAAQAPDMGYYEPIGKIVTRKSSPFKRGATMRRKLRLQNILTPHISGKTAFGRALPSSSQFGLPNIGRVESTRDSNRYNLLRGHRTSDYTVLPSIGSSRTSTDFIEKKSFILNRLNHLVQYFAERPLRNTTNRETIAQDGKENTINISSDGETNTLPLIAKIPTSKFIDVAEELSEAPVTITGITTGRIHSGLESKGYGRLVVVGNMVSNAFGSNTKPKKVVLEKNGLSTQENITKRSYERTLAGDQLDTKQIDPPGNNNESAWSSTVSDTKITEHIKGTMYHTDQIRTLNSLTSGNVSLPAANIASNTSDVKWRNDSISDKQTVVREISKLKTYDNISENQANTPLITNKVKAGAIRLEEGHISSTVAMPTKSGKHGIFFPSPPHTDEQNAASSVTPPVLMAIDVQQGNENVVKTRTRLTGSYEKSISVGKMISNGNNLRDLVAEDDFFTNSVQPTTNQIEGRDISYNNPDVISNNSVVTGSSYSDTFSTDRPLVSDIDHGVSLTPRNTTGGAYDDQGEVASNNYLTETTESWELSSATNDIHFRGRMDVDTTLNSNAAKQNRTSTYSIDEKPTKDNTRIDNQSTREGSTREENRPMFPGWPRMNDTPSLERNSNKFWQIQSPEDPVGIRLQKRIRSQRRAKGNKMFHGFARKLRYRVAPLSAKAGILHHRKAFLYGRRSSDTYLKGKRYHEDSQNDFYHDEDGHHSDNDHDDQQDNNRHGVPSFIVTDFNELCTLKNGICIQPGQCATDDKHSKTRFACNITTICCLPKDEHTAYDEKNSPGNKLYGPIRFDEVTNKSALCELKGGACVHPDICISKPVYDHNGDYHYHQEDHNALAKSEFHCNLTTICCLPEKVEISFVPRVIQGHVPDLDSHD